MDDPANRNALLEAMSRGATPDPGAWAQLQGAIQQAGQRRMRTARALGAPVPEALVISLTTRCPDACAFCAAGDRPPGHDLPEGVAERIVAEAEALGTSVVILAGGEPLLRADLAFRLVEAHPGLLFLLFTGGAGMTEAMSLRARSANLLTVVGSDPDREHAEACLDRLRRAGAAFGFSAVLRAPTAEGLVAPDFLRRMRDQGCRVGFLFEQMPVGRAAGSGWGCGALLRERILSRLPALARETGMLLRLFPSGESAWGGCVAAGKGILHVNAEGVVEPCPFIRLPCGSLQESSLVEVLRSASLSELRAVASRASCEQPCALLAGRETGEAS